MNEEEIINIFCDRTINTKVNNYIFAGVEDFKILDLIPNRCGISFQEYGIDIPFAQNIKIDLAETNLREVLTFTLEELKKLKLLDVYFDYTLDFQRHNLFKFEHVLSDYTNVVQMLFYNLEKLSLEEQMLFNEIYWFNSPFFNANAFIKGNHFQTYFLVNDRVLDNRENYTEVEFIRKREI